MDIVDILITKYPDEWLAGKMAFVGFSDGTVAIERWDLDIPQPTIQEIQSWEGEVAATYAVNAVVEKGMPLIEEYIDSVARSKQYKNAVSCVSYINSTNEDWKNQANAFISWRDTVYAYCISQVQAMRNGAPIISDFQEIIAQLPTIEW